MRWTYRRIVAFTPRRSELPHLLNARGLLGEGVELGVQQGLFSAEILSSWKGARLHLVDPWRAFEATEYVDIATYSQERQDELHDETVERMQPFGDRAQIHRAASPEAAQRFADGSLDFVYLDARHDYASVLVDLDAWYPKIRPGGILLGHDYLDGRYNATQFGVRSAVSTFSATHGLSVWGTYRDRPWVSFVAVVGGAKPRAIERMTALATRAVAAVADRRSGERLPPDESAGPIVCGGVGDARPLRTL
jgi:Methyltransferase domain